MHHILIQRAARKTATPTTALLRQWASTALKTCAITSAELTIRIINEKEMTHLNAVYRKKNKPTNVLSFPFNSPNDITMTTPLLGDIVICASVVEQEALDQQKTLVAHWAHMVVHGTLHLLGYDHEKNEDADNMEALEIQILTSLGFNNPYETTGHE